MDAHGGRGPGIARIVSLTVLALAAVVAGAEAFIMRSPSIGALAVVLGVAFVILTWAYVRADRVAASGRGARIVDVPAAPPSTETRQREEPAASWLHEPASADPRTLEPAETPAVRPAPIIRTPATLDPDVVCMAVLESSTTAGEPVSVHFWLEDPSSGTLRNVASVGTMVPAAHPLGLEDDPLGIAVTSDTARLAAVAAVHVSGQRGMLYRYAVPVQADDARGVVGIDFSSAEPPDTGVLVEVTATLRPALAGCLALHVARTQTATAKALLQAAKELSRRLDPDEVVGHALSRAMALSDAETGSIMLLDDATGLMRIVAAQGLQPEVVRDTRVREGEGIAGWVLATRKPVLIEDLPGREGRARRGEVRSAVSVPVGDESGLLGVLSVGSREYPARFTDAHMDALTLLGTQTAIALRNARALTSARELYFATLRALSLALETKDPYARGATDRVARFTALLADELGLEETERQALEVAALLHDIGMSAAGENVAVSDRPLSTFERGLLKLHPVLAAEILEEVPALRAVIPIVYHHHEWFDGTGYVVGLAGESIPLGARVLAVADAFVAMTSDRPYRNAMSVASALEELQTKSGSQFDPEVVGAFLDLLRRQPELAPDTQRG